MGWKPIAVHRWSPMIHRSPIDGPLRWPPVKTFRVLYKLLQKSRREPVIMSLTVQHLPLHYKVLYIACFALVLFVWQHCLHRGLRTRGAKIVFIAADVSF